MGADDAVEPQEKEEKIVEGTVSEELPNALYRVTLADKRELLAHVADRRALDFLRLLPGDRVRVRLSPYDDRRGRILRKETT